MQGLLGQVDLAQSGVFCREALHVEPLPEVERVAVAQARPCSVFLYVNGAVRPVDVEDHAGLEPRDAGNDFRRQIQLSTPPIQEQPEPELHVIAIGEVAPDVFIDGKSIE